MKIYDKISNLVGMFWGVGLAPTPGAKSYTVTAVLQAAELTDVTNWLRLSVYADFGSGPRFMARGPEWNGRAGASNPAWTWQFDAATPSLVYGVIENGTRGNGSPAIVSELDGAFA